jgi:hypothetical protein
MTRHVRDIRTLAVFMGLFTVVWLFIVPQATSANKSDGTSVKNSASGVSDEGDLWAAPTAASESWRLGVTSEGAASYGAIVRRDISEVAAFRSDRGTGDIYYVFPAPSSQRTIAAARFNIVSRSGAYSGGTAALTLEIIDFGGTMQHTVSAAEIDVQSAATGVWTALGLSGNPADLEIAPGEFLAVHFALSGGPGGDLDVRPIFEVDVE